MSGTFAVEEEGRKQRNKKKITGCRFTPMERNNQMNNSTKILQSPKALVNLKALYNKSNITTTKSEKNMLKAFREHTGALQEMFVCLLNKDDGSLLVIIPAFSSRYTSLGRNRIAKKIMKRMPRITDGVFLTLTYNHNAPKENSWKNLNKDLKEFTNKVRIYRKREAKKRGSTPHKLEYFRVIEVQKNDYPHVHIFFLDTHHLLGQRQLEHMWNHGFIKVQYKTTNMAKYMTKYLVKGQGWDDLSQAYIWKYHIRIYSMSRGLCKKEEKPKTSWEIFKFGNIKDLGMAIVDWEGLYPNGTILNEKMVYERIKPLIQGHINEELENIAKAHEKYVEKKEKKEKKKEKKRKKESKVLPLFEYAQKLVSLEI